MLHRHLQRSVRSYATAGFQPTKYGGKFTATLIPGDGIGQEVATSVKEIFSATNVPVEFEEVDATGILAAEGPDGGEALYRKAVESIRRNKVGLKGILYTPLERSGHASFNVALRQELDLYASTVFIKNFPGLVTRHSGIDAVIIRENTEGEYSGLEQQAVPGVVEALKVITRTKSERIARFAFDFAQRNGRKKITVIHKANIMKLADGLFRDVFYETSKDYPDIKANDMIVDNASMQAVSKPQQFDVMLMPNLYGSILSNVMGGLVGGPGLIPGCNIGREYALFEPGCRHVGLDIKGKDQANPLAMVLSSCMMLRHLGLDSFANAIARAAYAVIEEGKVRTRDMGGQNSTHDMTKAILDKITL